MVDDLSEILDYLIIDFVICPRHNKSCIYEILPQIKTLIHKHVET
jgi:hypothetical protein